jgi:hypothetical protein
LRQAPGSAADHLLTIHLPRHIETT